jgi:Domain of unknown function (DUF4399)
LAPGTRPPSPAGTRVYIISPANGAYLPNTFTVQFGLAKMGVGPAGIHKPNTGHQHLLVDAVLPPLDQPIPNDENHLHFGAGQTQTSLTLPTGKHTLHTAHLPHQPPVYSDPIVVYVGMSPPRPRQPVTENRNHPRVEPTSLARSPRCRVNGCRWRTLRLQPKTAF